MPIKNIKELVNKDNIAEDLSEKELSEIGSDCLAGFDEDLSSCNEWLQCIKEVIDLAALKGGTKNTPMPNSANIKFPIITKAAYEFSSRTYPEIVKDGKVVKCRILGRDIFGEKQKQADRVSDFMNYQLMFQNDDWEQELDRSLNNLAIVGFLCKKTYYDPVRDKVKSEICDYDDLIINSKVKCLQDAPRINHILHYRLNELIEHARAGVYSEEVVKELVSQYKDTSIKSTIDVVEQHTYLDLDEDDYEEPYIVTFVKDSGKVLRIAPRFSSDGIKKKKDKIYYIEPDHYFTDYHFLPSPKGDFQSVGFGTLMMHLNETVNTIMNQLTDAGKIANIQTGIINSRAKVLESGDLEVVPGKLTKVKTDMPLRDAVTMLDFKEPSSVLFQLLGMLIDASRDLSSSTEVMSGSSSPENVKSGAMMALIEQAMKVFNAIQKRIYRSLCHEYRKIFRLNKKYLDPEVYVNVLDDELAVMQKDFDESTINVIPVADPNLSSDVTRMAQAQFIGSLIGSPGIKPEEVVKYLLETSKIPNPQRFLVSDEEMQKMKQAPNPDMIKLQADIENQAQQLNIKGKELELAEKRLMLDSYKVECEIAKMKTESILNLAKAEAEEAGTQLQDYQLQLNIIQEKIKNIMSENEQSADMYKHENEMAMRQQELQNANQQNVSPGVEEAPSDQSSDQGLTG